MARGWPGRPLRSPRHALRGAQGGAPLRVGRDERIARRLRAAELHVGERRDRLEHPRHHRHAPAWSGADRLSSTGTAGSWSWNVPVMLNPGETTLTASSFDQNEILSDNPSAQNAPTAAALTGGQTEGVLKGKGLGEQRNGKSRQGLRPPETRCHPPLLQCLWAPASPSSGPP